MNLIHRAMQVSRRIYRENKRSVRHKINRQFVELVDEWLLRNHVPRLMFWKKFYEAEDEEIHVPMDIHHLLMDVSRALNFKDKIYISEFIEE
jgi:hypothetical protein